MRGHRVADSSRSTVRRLRPGNAQADGGTRRALKLEIELVPRTSWQSNLRKILPRQAWDRIRKEAYERASGKCEICGEQARLECHERWVYDDTRHVQRLAGFMALCPLCHAVKHMGRSWNLARQGKLDFDELVRHFMSVNGVSRELFQFHYEEAFRVWRVRSRYPWKIDLGAWEALVKTSEAPNLTRQPRVSSPRSHCRSGDTGRARDREPGRKRPPHADPRRRSAGRRGRWRAPGRE